MTIKALLSDFVLNNVDLTWREALWGYERQLIGWYTLRDLANQRLRSGNDIGISEWELATIQKNDASRAADIARDLAQKEPEASEETAKRKWLYLCLKWAFDHKEQFPEPLMTVEEIYADFDYPEEVEKFVRYMPSSNRDPSRHTAAENRERLYALWSKYLSDEKEKLR